MRHFLLELERLGLECELGYSKPMPITLPLDQMTVKEKLAIMEQLWEDLARIPGAIESPAWHKEILDERSATPGHFTDWEKAKTRIRRKRA